jgi:hypothetical protein
MFTDAFGELEGLNDKPTVRESPGWQLNGLHVEKRWR